MTARDFQALIAAASRADPRTDAALLAAADDPAAFAELVRRHGPLVWAACRRLLGEADAADAFQATFLALYRSAGRLRDPAAVGPWLHTAAVRAATSHRRSAARRRARERRAARPDAGTPVADTAWAAMLAAVHEEVERLPAGERTAFILCELQGVPAGEAAVRLGWKPGTLSGRLSKARAKLLERLAARGLAPAVGVASLGTLAVPAAVAAKAAECVGPAVGVSPAVATLAAEVTAIVATKYMAAAVLLTAGILAVAAGVAVRAGGNEPAPAARRAAAVLLTTAPAAPAAPGRLLISTDSAIHRWYSPDGKPLEPLPERFEYRERALAVSPDRRWVARVGRRKPDDPLGVFGYLSFARADGSGQDCPIDLKGDAIWAANLLWSKDSTRILVAGSRGDGKGNWSRSANLVDIPDGRMTPVPLPAGVAAQDWSADGGRLLVAEPKGEGKALRVRLAWLPVAGGPLECLTPADEFCTRGLTSADGKRIYYLKKDPESDPKKSVMHLVCRRLSDGAETRLADGTAVWVHNFVPSPDGGRVAYSAKPWADIRDVVERFLESVIVVDADGRNRRTVLTHEHTGKYGGIFSETRLISWCR